MVSSSSDALGRSRSLLWLDRFLRLVTVVFAVGTIAFAVAFGSLVGGQGGVGVDAILEPPLEVSVQDGPTFALRGDGEVEDRVLGIESADVRAKVRLSEDDRDSRVVMAASGALLIAAFWIGLVMTRRIVGSARQGAPFDARNVFRLRVLAALFVAVPVGAEISRRLLASTVDADPRLSVSIATPDWGVFLLVALGLLALAEVFNEGTALRDFEESTI